jgi:hypothetical protein
MTLLYRGSEWKQILLHLSMRYATITFDKDICIEKLYPLSIRKIFKKIAMAEPKNNPDYPIPNERSEGLSREKWKQVSVKFLELQKSESILEKLDIAYKL